MQRYRIQRKHLIMDNSGVGAGAMEDDVVRLSDAEAEKIKYGQASFDRGR